MGQGQVAFILSWTQTEVDGLRGRPAASVEIGSRWRWSGRAVSLSGSPACPTASWSGAPVDLSTALRSIRHVVGRSVLRGRLSEGFDIEDPHLERFFVLSDGSSRYAAGLVEIAELSRPLLLFHGGLPPCETDLLVVHCSADEPTLPALAEEFDPAVAARDLARAASAGGRH